MKVIIFGTTGLLGQGVLRECLGDPEVESILSIVRSSSGQKDAKLQELVQRDFFDYSRIEESLKGYDACFFCLGVSSVGMSEEAYQRLTYDLTIAAARALITHNPNMVFVYVSAMGADSSELGSVMWARVRGKTENAILKLPFKGAYIFRPGYIQPLPGYKSKKILFRILYALLTPLYPLLKTLIPKYVTSTEQMGQAMLKLSKQGTEKKLFENLDFNRLNQKN